MTDTAKRRAANKAACMIAEIISMAHDEPTVKGVLERAGLSYNSFKGWQRGKNSPNLTSIIAVLDALDCMLVIIEKPSAPLTGPNKRP